jgi:16S rRNA (guanine527-N7)-methyltransferase
VTLQREKVQEAFEKAGLISFFSSEAISALICFTEKMLQINENLNLTRWIEEEQVINFHLLDSAFCLPSLQELVKNQASQQWLDLGTGCGFPGGVLIAAFPQMKVTLLDSVAKKIKALEECLLAANWQAETLVGRAEEIGQREPYREKWNGLVCRAVADFRVVLEYGIPLLKTGGYLVNWMTEDQLTIVDKSQNALSALNAKVIQTKNYSLPGTNQRRYFVIVEKLGKTSLTYPRLIGQPSKNPL